MKNETKKRNNYEEQKGSHLYDLCDSFYLFKMRSGNNNVKLLQYSKIK